MDKGKLANCFWRAPKFNLFGSSGLACYVGPLRSIQKEIVLNGFLAILRNNDYVPNRLLDPSIHSMRLARLLDNLSSLWARPVRSTKNLVNGNEAHLLDQVLGFGPGTPIQSPLPQITSIGLCGRNPQAFSFYSNSLRYVANTRIYRIFNNYIPNCPYWDSDYY